MMKVQFEYRKKKVVGTYGNCILYRSPRTVLSQPDHLGGERDTGISSGGTGGR